MKRRRKHLRHFVFLGACVFLLAASWVGVNKFCTSKFRLCKVVEIGDQETAVWILKWRPEAAEETCDRRLRPLFETVSSGITPLHLAAWYGDEQICSVLISRGADVNARSKSGWTPLHLAADRQTALVLLKAGADMEARDALSGGGGTPLHSAAALNRPGVISVLLDARMDVDIKQNGLGAWTPLHSAAFAGSTEAIVVLLKHGAALNQKSDTHGWTALAMAAQLRGHLEASKVLIAAGANLNTIDNRGRSLLHGTRGDGSTLMEVLLKAGLNPNLRDIDGNTPLISARDPEKAEILIQNGANVNAVNKDGQGAIHFAVIMQDIDYVKLLLRHEAQTEVKDRYGKTPVNIAEDKIQQSRLLLQAPVTPEQKEKASASIRNMSTIMKLFRKHGS